MADEIDGVPLDDSVPMPKPVAKSNRYRKVIRQMDTGQSFLVYGELLSNRARNAAKLATRDEGKEFTIRKEKDNFYRVWRTK